MDANMQLTVNSKDNFSLTRFFPDTSLTFRKIPDVSPTAVKIPDISRFSRQGVTPHVVYQLLSCTSRDLTITETKNISDQKQHLTGYCKVKLQKGTKSTIRIE